MKFFSWNILAEKYYDERYELTKSSEISSRIPTPYRREKIISIILEKDCDIICLQEVGLRDISIFQKLFENYDFIVHEINKKRTNEIGNLTLWKKNRFELLASSQTSSAIHVHLLDKKDQIKIFISNIHLKAGLRSGQNERSNQLSSTLKQIEKIPENDRDESFILGDFNDNLSKNGELIKLIKDFQKSEPFDSCFVPFGLSRHNPNSFWKLDHLLFSSKNKILKNMEFSKKSIIPSLEIPSDHFWVIYEF